MPKREEKCNCGTKLEYDPPQRADPEIGAAEEPERWWCCECGHEVTGQTFTDRTADFENIMEAQRTGN